MTNQVLFVQGGGEGAHDKWDNKIVKSLERALGPDYPVRYPRMPHEADPKSGAWKVALKRQFDRLEGGAVLIGHSIGGTILIRTLADQPPTLTFAGVFLIYAHVIPQVIVRRLPGRDHQLNNDMSEVAADIRSIT